MQLRCINVIWFEAVHAVLNILFGMDSEEQFLFEYVWEHLVIRVLILPVQAYFNTSMGIEKWYVLRGILHYGCLIVNMW